MGTDGKSPGTPGPLIGGVARPARRPAKPATSVSQLNDERQRLNDVRQRLNDKKRQAGVSRSTSLRLPVRYPCRSRLTYL